VGDLCQRQPKGDQGQVIRAQAENDCAWSRVEGGAWQGPTGIQVVLGKARQPAHRPAAHAAQARMRSCRSAVRCRTHDKLPHSRGGLLGRHRAGKAEGAQHVPHMQGGGAPQEELCGEGCGWHNTHLAAMVPSG